MAGDSDIPRARAVGGVPSDHRAAARRWFTRRAVVIDRDVRLALTGQCACCRGATKRGASGEYCARCVRHQRLYRFIVVAAFCGSVWVGLQMATAAIELAPFAGKWLHAAIVFGLAAAAPMVFVLGANLVRSEPAHGHWGRAVHCRSNNRGSRSLYRHPDYGHSLAANLGVESSTREITEPRSGWAVIAAFLVVVPATSAGLAALQYDQTRFVVYVDNGSDHGLRIDVLGHGEVGRVGAGQTSAISLPRAAMTMIATSDGAEIERVTVGALDQILAGTYPELFPDIEHDTADVFVWNVQRLRCYSASTKMYGSIGGIGGGPTIHNEKTFVSNTDVPFEYAPSSVESTLPFDVRSELIRVPCR